MNIINPTLKQFQYYKSLGDKTISQLSNTQIFWKYNDESNSCAIIMKHIAGNMLSRWTDFRTTDGEKVWRKRDSEFADDIKDRNELVTYWERGWSCLFDALRETSDEELNEIIYIRNQGHTIAEAINRQLAHYAYHIGQIVFIGKMLKDNEWQSLSIPKGNSKIYNEGKFKKEKSKGHYTDEFLEEK